MANSCVLAGGGRPICWGDNGAGQLGDGTLTPRLTPTPVELAPGIAFENVGSLAVGNAHGCGLVADGRPFCWGYNGNHQLGEDPSFRRSTPVLVPFPPPSH